MKIVLDTNVFVSGIFFGGPPAAILEAWQSERVELAVSLEILAEYERVCNELSAHFPHVDPSKFWALVALNADLFECPPLPEKVCDDPDDDKFLSCALATNAKVVVSGDKQLLRCSGYHNIEVITPRNFVDRFSSQPPNDSLR